MPKKILTKTVNWSTKNLLKLTAEFISFINRKSALDYYQKVTISNTFNCKRQLKTKFILLAYGVVFVSCQDEEYAEAVAQPAEGVQEVEPSSATHRTSFILFPRVEDPDPLNADPDPS
jgi:hypothetical protein